MTPSSTTNPQPTRLQMLVERYRQLYQTPVHGSSSRAPHPGDILYWLGCVGALSAILFVATR